MWQSRSCNVHHQTKIDLLWCSFHLWSAFFKLTFREENANIIYLSVLDQTNHIPSLLTVIFVCCFLGDRFPELDCKVVDGCREQHCIS